MRKLDFEIKTFAYAVELLREYSAWELELTKQDANDLKNAINRAANLLGDIDLNPDRKYTIEEIGRLQTAIQLALGGDR